jgi:hypothetical protein
LNGSEGPPIFPLIQWLASFSVDVLVSVRPQGFVDDRVTGVVGPVDVLEERIDNNEIRCRQEMFRISLPGIHGKVGIDHKKQTIRHQVPEDGVSLGYQTSVFVESIPTEHLNQC